MKTFIAIAPDGRTCRWPASAPLKPGWRRASDEDIAAARMLGEGKERDAVQANTLRDRNDAIRAGKRELAPPGTPSAWDRVHGIEERFHPADDRVVPEEWDESEGVPTVIEEPAE